MLLLNIYLNSKEKGEKMEGVLTIFAFLVFVIVITEIINEKFLKISNNIALLITSFTISILFLLGIKINLIDDKFFVFSSLNKLNLDELLLDGFLCFMLFAGAGKLQFSKFVSNFKSISFLSLLTTITSSMVYGLLFFGISNIFKISIGFEACLLLGCIVSPTDPIAATSILNKLGLPKSISSVIEGESLFNDGIGVALFVFVKNIITNANSENFFLIMGKNLIGAIIVGLVISFLLFKLVKQTKNPNLHILISLLDVSLCYVLCEYLEFSGVIASVICGMYFSYQNKKCERWKAVVDSNNLYVDFWNIIDELLNNILFVLIGLTVFVIPFNYSLLFLIPIAILVNFISRYLGVFLSCLLLGGNSIPNKYSLKNFTKLMTFSALRGGISLAMAFSVSSIFIESEFNIILNVTIITILFTTIVQGMLIPKVYRRIEMNKCTKSLIKS